MRILVSHPLATELAESWLGDLVVYRPELAAQGEDALRQALVDQAPDAVITGDAPGPATLGAWKDQARREVKLIQRRPEEIGNARSDLRALGLAERSLMRSRTAERLAALGVSRHPSSPSSSFQVTLVGAGIVNLITACDLVEHGAAVEILEAGPDPRTRPDWQRLGATHGGDNARMFCFTEADNYNQKQYSAYARRSVALGRRVTEGGWLVVPPAELDEAEHAWIRSFHDLPCWRARVFGRDIHRFNVASGELWERMRRRSPSLFDGVRHTEGILRIYSRAEEAGAARELHRSLGSLRATLDREALGRRHPAFREAAENGEIAGAIEVTGFTLAIHDFVDRLLAHLEARGARFCWNLPVQTLERTSGVCVSGLRTREGVVRSDHYVLSPGAYGTGLLEGTRSSGKIQGILGVWLRLPDLEPRLRHSVKIHRQGHVGEHSNLILAAGTRGRPILILGAGYGFLGSRPLDMGSPQVAHLFETVEETARRYLPRAHARAVRDGTLIGERKACVRPFTSTGLGIFEVDRTALGGRLVIASGHNTGGFAQAPVVAEAVAATLRGETHPMQYLYDPERGWPHISQTSMPTSPSIATTAYSGTSCQGSRLETGSEATITAR